MMNWCNLARFEKNGPYTKGCGDMVFHDDVRHGIVGQCFLAGRASILPNYGRHGLVLATQNVGLIKKMISGSRLAIGSGGVVS